MRYWYLDGANHVTLLLVDKGYYDYDYERPSEKEKAAHAVKNDDDLKLFLKNIGVKSVKGKSRDVKAARCADLTRSVSASDLKNMDMERLQSYAMAQVGDATDAKR